MLRKIEKKVLWLSAWMIQQRQSSAARSRRLEGRRTPSKLRLGSHTLTALYMDATPEDRVAIKPHASPVYAIMYLLGRQTQEKMQDFRALGGCTVLSLAHQGHQRRRFFDRFGWTFGVATTLFASLIRKITRKLTAEWADGVRGCMVALMGDAELDEGNVFEALPEGWKQKAETLWITDYN